MVETIEITATFLLCIVIIAVAVVVVGLTYRFVRWAFFGRPNSWGDVIDYMRSRNKQ